jgi:hypothetical protein
MQPYTYLIRHTPTGKVYYGVRTANKVEPHNDLWKHYFTSSPGVQKLIEETGVDSFVAEIRKTFETKEAAVAWETRVLHRCKVLHDDRWLNQNVAGYIVPTEESNKKISDYHKDRPKTDAHKKNLSESQKGKPKNYVQTKEHRRKNSEANSGKNNPMYGPCSEERAANISAAKKGKPAKNKGVPMSEEQKALIRATKAANPYKWDAETLARRVASQTGLKRLKLYCEHCKRDIAVGWFHRHGSNCRNINTS